MMEWSLPLTSSTSHANFVHTQTQNKHDMAGRVTVESRYLAYNKAEVEALLDKVESMTEASEESVRDIVRNWSPSREQKPSHGE